eukprot:CAMPEP_0198285942 /NCGR_PEP_ID=MMETSP1449-20131203/5162_1 /TAXON_ID=420275 /ORGANISM="Attheya septentrionalis, Strain CCMP2084" /LENGTH=511 /DNA_ID=CAMNT_0043983557 /DNA_START=538 /DNA_END=2073 /DNA_ORIENTATION=-
MALNFNPIMVKLLLGLAIFLCGEMNSCAAYLPGGRVGQLIYKSRSKQKVATRDSVAFARRQERSSSVKRELDLSMSNNSGGGQFDVTKLSFDLFSLRSIRGDALLQYDSLNQSEPLRINLYALIAFSLWSFPTLSESVVGENLTPVGTAASVLAGAVSAGLFARECGRRSKQLTRIEKELNAQSLVIRLPANRFADRRLGDAVSLKQLNGSKRIIAICGSASQLKSTLLSFRVLRKRLEQAGVLVVVVPNDQSDRSEWGLSEQELRSVQWLAEADIPSWLNYFRDLQFSGDDDTKIDAEKRELIWFGLTNSGRSFASGINEDPRLLEILGQSFRPVDILYEDENTDSTITGDDKVTDEMVKGVLSAQESFYSSLTKGDLKKMNEIFAQSEAAEVTEVLNAGGRVDSWSTCLEEGARPAGMITSGSDVLVVSETEAYSTTIEFPAIGIDSASLLAVQRWTRESPTDPWKLLVHQTIPWSPVSKANGTLRCDYRGCVALTSTPEKRSFGGLVG